jgi:glutamyl-tRNA synthetase
MTMTLAHNSELLAEVIDLIFPDALPTPAELEARYPPRDLPQGAMVTRVGPSPTGMMHIGTLYVGLLSERFAQQSGGVFFLRVEDTDKKREVEGATDFISNAFEHYGVVVNEGRDVQGVEHGAYGPYTQSARMSLYQTYVRHLMSEGKAYPCFCSPEELDELRTRQQLRNVAPGYYGDWAIWRHKSLNEALEALKAGKPYVIRFRSPGNPAEKVAVTDLIFGERTFPESDQDIVIMKSDRLPTYHLAHAVDDHLMRTTHVIRGDEWLASLPTHLQLFQALGWTPPTYAHIAPINKLDGSSKRKLSKRKDPEASVIYFMDHGYPTAALIEYLLNLANSNFEDWRKENPTADYRSFPLSFERLAKSNGPLFDFTKLDNISRDIVARLSAEEVYAQIVEWATTHDAPFAEVLEAEKAYAIAILSIERGGPNARKDIAKWQDAKALMAPFFDTEFTSTAEDTLSALGNRTAEEVREIVSDFLGVYDETDSKEAWFDKVKTIARDRGFAEKAGDYKRNPELYKGTVADVAKIFRVLLLGQPQTPDLHEVMAAMGRDRVIKRLTRV